MHDSVLQFVAKALTLPCVRGKRILEVGSLDVNGSPRDILIPLGPSEYIGVDIAPGKGVDAVCDARFLESSFGLSAFDIVLSTEMLEHVEDWKAVVSQMKRVTKGGGLLCITTRSPGFPYHPHPVDCWRFTKSNFRDIFRDCSLRKLEDDLPGSPGIFGCFGKPFPFKEASLDSISVERVPQR